MNPFPEKNIALLITPLLCWYDKAKREMAWRSEVSPYRTWVSEIMLQQTRVEAVHGYFARWMQALPDIKAVAEASPETLYKLWEGLGYYSRVRNLQKAARIVCDDMGGFLPSEEEQLLKLPGIGEYTAGAIRSIAFNKPAAAVDGNVIRVFARYLGIHTDISDAKSKRALAASIKAVSPAGRHGDFTQSLMELGALVCIPGNPRCEHCPLRALCKGYADGDATTLPVLPKKPEKSVEYKTVCVLTAEDGFWLRKRPEKGLLAGLWEPWNCEGTVDAQELQKLLSEQGIAVQEPTSLGEVQHIFTHKIWKIKGFACRCEQADGFEKVPFRHPEHSVPKAFDKFLKGQKK